MPRQGNSGGTADLFRPEQNGFIRLNRKPKGNLVKGINGKLVKVRDSLPEGYTLDEFKRAFQERYPVAYDIYDGNKGERLDKWLENVIKSLPKTK